MSMKVTIGCLAVLGIMALALAFDVAICYVLALLVHAAFHAVSVFQAFVVLFVLSFVLTWVGKTASGAK